MEPAPMTPEALDRCPWLCGAPLGPGTPFAWPVFFVVDSFRVYIIVAAFILICISVWAIRRADVRGQKGRFVYAALMTIGALGTELDRLGDLPHWRFAVYLAGVTIGLWSYYEHLFRELPARDRPARQDPSP